MYKLENKKSLGNVLIEKNKKFKRKNGKVFDTRSFIKECIEPTIIEFSKLSLIKECVIKCSEYEQQMFFDGDHIVAVLDSMGFDTHWYNHRFYINWMNVAEEDKNNDLMSIINENQNNLANIEIKNFVYEKIFKKISEKEECCDKVLIKIPVKLHHSSYIDGVIELLKIEDIYAKCDDWCDNFIVYTSGSYEEVEMKLAPPKKDTKRKKVRQNPIIVINFKKSCFPTKIKTKLIKLYVKLVFKIIKKR